MRWLREAGHECRVLTTARFESPVTFTIDEHLRGLGAPLSGVARQGQGGRHQRRRRPVVQYVVDNIPVTLLLTRHNDETHPDRAEAAQYDELLVQLLQEFAPDQLIACNAHPMIRAALATAR